MSTKPIPAPSTPAKQSPVPSTATSTASSHPVGDKAARARAGRKEVPKDETPEQTFKRLTEPRVMKALKVVKQLQNMSRFKPSDAHREKVFGVIRAALTVAENSWKGTATASEGFSL